MDRLSIDGDDFVAGLQARIGRGIAADDIAHAERTILPFGDQTERVDGEVLALAGVGDKERGLNLLRLSIHRALEGDGDRGVRVGRGAVLNLLPRGIWFL